MCLDGLDASELGNWVHDITTRGPLAEVWSAFWYGDALQGLIHKLKYTGLKRIGPSLAQAVHRALDAEIDWSEFSLIIPVPLHKKRRRKRGFNQSEVIGEELGRLTGIPVESDQLQRVVNTQSQVGLDVVDRRKNVDGSFVHELAIDGESILLVDDLLTTGATAAACATALRSAGATKVSVITVATPKN